MSSTSFSLFSVLGIEIEYMLVDRDTLMIQGISDELLAHLAGGDPVNAVTLGDIDVSNELVMHVLELKNNGPRAPDAPIAQHFQHAIHQLQPLLQQHNLHLLPTGAHPWMDPHTETKRWPHGNRSIYQQYDTIFNCKGHGWANLQSMHVNLPFANDEEFGALHNTVRLLLPLLPALAASTPFLDGAPTRLLDSRLYFYGNNQQKIRSISGDVIPEFIQTQAEYQTRILEPMYHDIAPFDPQGLLQEEWLNSRGAIPKFDAGAVEIRIIDSQECVNADIAIAHAVHAILKSWCVTGHYPTPPNVDTHALKAVYEQAIKTGFAVSIDDTAVLTAWQLPKRTMTARDAWSLLIERVSGELTRDEQTSLEHTLRHGNLSERILKACRMDYTRPTLLRVYRDLSECLLNNQLFTPS